MKPNENKWHLVSFISGPTLISNNSADCFVTATDIETNDLTADDYNHYTQLRIEATFLRLNPFYVKYYLIYLNFIIHGLIPLIVLLILNTLIYRQASHDQSICVPTSYSSSAVSSAFFT